MLPVRLLAMYLKLAQASGQRQRPLVVVRMLVLACVVAARMKLRYLPAYIRRRVLDENPHHLLGRFLDVEEALQDEEFLHVLKQLQRRYGLERAEQLLAQLNITLEDDWESFPSLEDYAAHLLGTTLEDIVGE